MKKCLIHSIITPCLLLLSMSGHAANINSYWQCSTTDSADKVWVGRDINRQAAINQSAQACRDNTENEGSCISARESCVQVVNNRIVRPSWRCTAFDMTTYYRGAVQYTREDTIESALDKCRRLSFSPNTCKVNMLTCKNV